MPHHTHSLWLVGQGRQWHSMFDGFAPVGVKTRSDVGSKCVVCTYIVCRVCGKHSCTWYCTRCLSCNACHLCRVFMVRSSSRPMCCGPSSDGRSCRGSPFLSLRCVCECIHGNVGRGEGESGCEGEGVHHTLLYMIQEYRCAVSVSSYVGCRKYLRRYCGCFLCLPASNSCGSS